VIRDGEGVIRGPDGVSDFDRMRAVFSRKGSPDVFLYAFDVLELDGRDLRAQRWDARRALLTQLLGAHRGRGRRRDRRQAAR
jgi:bifunctional non-homologous end joining protein LigD